MFTLDSLPTKGKPPIEIPNVGRDTLAGWLGDFKTGVEVGVAGGKYSEIIAKSNPQMKLYGVDPYAAYRQYRDYTKRETFSHLRSEAHARLSNYPNFEFIEEMSSEALKRFKDNSLDFVYLDGNHEFSYVAQDITQWSRKLRPGGVLAGHDYARFSAPNFNHVFHVINAYTRAYDISPWFILGSQEIVEGQVRDKIRSWFWIK